MTGANSGPKAEFSVLNRPALDWIAYEVVAGILVLVSLASREDHGGVAALRHFPVEDLPALAGALTLSRTPEYLRGRKWWLGALLTALGCTSIVMGVILQAASDQHGHVGAWQVWLGYGAAVAAIVVTAICVDIKGSQEEQSEIEEQTAREMEDIRNALGGASADPDPGPSPGSRLRRIFHSRRRS